jgi:hypothetical protein
MKPVLRVGMSISGSIALSTLASWALRRLLWSVADGEERGEQRSSPMLVIMPIFVGNTWVIGQPKQLATPQARAATPRKHIFPLRRHEQWQRS